MVLVLDGCPELAAAHRLVRDFGDMLTQQTGVFLPAWIDKAVAADIKKIKRHLYGRAGLSS